MNGDGVGPVFTRGRVCDHLVALIRARHPDARFVDRGAYVRVLVPRECRLQRAEIEQSLGRGFALPADLEEVMASWKGTLRIADDEVVWSAGAVPAAGGLG
jgi:toluene monooxygenase system protein D